MFGPLLDYIAHRYRFSAKIVEIGVGRRPEVALGLARRLPESRVLMTDIDPGVLRAGRLHPSLAAVLDDAFNPTPHLYWGAGLVYALRPPSELVPAVARLARGVGADALVAPLAGEGDVVRDGTWAPLVRSGRHLGWIRPGPEAN